MRMSVAGAAPADQCSAQDVPGIVKERRGTLKGTTGVLLQLCDSLLHVVWPMPKSPFSPQLTCDANVPLSVQLHKPHANSAFRDGVAKQPAAVVPV